MSVPQFRPELAAEELTWFSEVAPTWPWRWARSYADSYPHSYVVKGKQVGAEDYERAVRLTLAVGEPRNFLGRVNIELHLPHVAIEHGPESGKELVRGVKFWPMTYRMSDSGVFNMAPMKLSYGEQTAARSRTLATRPSQFDFAAPDWHDLQVPLIQKWRIALWKLIVGDRYVPSLIELGPTPGYAIDLQLIDADAATDGRYAVIQESQGLMNQVIYRHDVRQAVCTAPGEWVDPGDYRAGIRSDTVVALFGAASYLKPSAIREAYAAAEKMLVLMHYRPGIAHREEDLGVRLPETAEESLEAARGLPGVRTGEKGDFVVSVVRK